LSGKAWREERKSMMLDRTCPKCGQMDVAEFLWGLPEFSPELEHDIEEGKIVIGGCCLGADSPQWKCNQCSHEWGNQLDQESER